MAQKPGTHRHWHVLVLTRTAMDKGFLWRTLWADAWAYCQKQDTAGDIKI